MYSLPVIPDTITVSPTCRTSLIGSASEMGAPGEVLATILVVGGTGSLVKSGEPDGLSVTQPHNARPTETAATLASPKQRSSRNNFIADIPTIPTSEAVKTFRVFL
jgi:hypothetical protein